MDIWYKEKMLEEWYNEKIITIHKKGEIYNDYRRLIAYKILLTVLQNWLTKKLKNTYKESTNEDLLRENEQKMPFT